MKRTKAEAEQTRQALLDSALQLFDDKSYQAVTLSEIASAAGLTRGALYWHFKNKADILNALAEQYLLPYQQKLEQICGCNIWAGLKTFYTQLFTGFNDAPLTLRFARIINTQFMQTAPDPAALEVLQKHKTPLHNSLQTLIKTAAEKGEIPPDTDTALAYANIDITVTGIMYGLAYNHSPVAIRPYAVRLISQTLDAIQAGSCRRQ